MVSYKLHDSSPGEALTILLYGGSGVGKTFLCGSLGSDTLIINTGQGIETLRSKAFRLIYPDSNPTIYDIRETEKVATAFDKICDILDTEIKEGKFKNIVIDDATFLSQYAQQKAIEMNLDSGKTKGGKRKIPMPVLQDYGSEQSIIKWFLSAYTSLAKEKNFNFILIAHDRSLYSSQKGEDSKLKKVFPNFVGKDYFAPSVVPAFFDEVWYLYMNGDKRYLKTQATSITVAKSRCAGSLKEVEESPNFPALFTKIKEQ
jgi:hypothetical protein